MIGKGGIHTDIRWGLRTENDPFRASARSSKSKKCAERIIK